MTEDNIELIAEALSRGVADKYKRILAIIEESPSPQPTSEAECLDHTTGGANCNSNFPKGCKGCPNLQSLQPSATADEIEKKLLSLFGFTEDGVDAENQCKIFAFMDWYATKPVAEREVPERER